MVLKDINTAKRGDPIIMINGVDYTKSSQYLPNSKAVYAWTGGISYNKIETKRSSTLKLFRWNVGSTKDLVDKINNEKLDVKTISTSEPSANGSTLQNGVFTDNSGDGNYLFTITSNRHSGGKVYGKTSVNSRDLDWFGVITEYTYTWTETTPNYVGTTYRINAAQPIAIQTTNKADSTINIINESNIIVDGDLGTGANGTVNLTSQYGNITTSADGKITDAKINLDAHENIDVTLGLPESKTTELKATTFDNDVKITANTPLKNLDISAGMFLGGKKATVVGTGDINGKIAASDLDITTPGNIDIMAQLSGKLNATGDNSVKVTQTSGDLKIGKVASKGDVSLTASDGAIINAVDSVFNMTGAADKINAWRAAGIISDKDSADSATNSAREEKIVRLQGLENLFKRWALKDDGTVDQTLYRQFVNNTADTTNLTEEQINQLKFYQDLKNSNDYGFSRNQLLYAIQEGLLNPKAGLTANISDPIITGKNITLNAKSIGKELAAKTYSDFTNIKTLEKLAGVKGGDVTLNRSGSITVTEQSPITVNATGDKLNVTTQGNTFISGTADTKYNVNTPINAGDGKVVLMTGNGIDANKGITAKDIELYAGAGDLNANLTPKTENVEEPTGRADTTITYTARNVDEYDYDRYAGLFNRYGNLSGFKVKVTSKEVRSFIFKTYDITATLTAKYNVNDTSATDNLKQAEQVLKSLSRSLTYSRSDVEETQHVTKTNDSVGTLTANAAGDINITADANLPIKNITSGSNVNVNAKGDIISADEDTRVTAPNVNLTSSNNIATRANSLNINAENTTLRAKYAYIIGDYGNLNAAGTNVESLNKASGGEENSPIISTPTINRPADNTSVVDLKSKWAYLTKGYNLFDMASNSNVTTPTTTVTTAQNNEFYKVALALSKSPALMTKSGDAYVAAAKAWLNSMGYSESEEQQIINLSLEIAFNNLSSSNLLNVGIADIVSKYSGSNISAKSVA